MAVRGGRRGRHWVLLWIGRAFEEFEEVAAGGGNAMVDAADGDDRGQIRVIDAEMAGEFVFVVEEGARGGGLFVEMMNGAIEEAE